jgi:multicomponent Na+:H+ antiporter subunit G
MEIVVEILVWVLLFIGSLFSVIGGFGIVRLPEFFSRMHAGGITDTMGAAFIIGGLMVWSGCELQGLTTLKLFMIIFFLLITSPTACHALAKSALAQGLEPELEMNTMESNEND